MDDEPIECISAVTLVTGDMATSVAFYETLGMVAVAGGATADFTSMRAGTGHLNLQAGTPPSAAGPVWGRVILWVADVDALHARAVAAGLVPEAAPADAPWGERYFHLRDPDGHELSFARLLQR